MRPCPAIAEGLSTGLASKRDALNVLDIPD